MSELIDRNKAYLAIEDLKQIHFDRKVVLSKAQKAIMSLPTIQPEPHWIPVTERLPEKEGRYLVTNSKIGGWIIDIDFYRPYLGGWMYDQGVLAYMPLPEPYKGEGMTT